MLHADRRLPEPEHTALRAAIAHRTSSGAATTQLVDDRDSPGQ
jgi:hypothetical protein